MLKNLSLNTINIKVAIIIWLKKGIENINF